MGPPRFWHSDTKPAGVTVGLTVAEVSGTGSDGARSITQYSLTCGGIASKEADGVAAVVEMGGVELGKQRDEEHRDISGISGPQCAKIGDETRMVEAQWIVDWRLDASEPQLEHLVR